MKPVFRTPLDVNYPPPSFPPTPPQNESVNYFKFQTCHIEATYIYGMIWDYGGGGEIVTWLRIQGIDGGI